MFWDFSLGCCGRTIPKSVKQQQFAFKAYCQSCFGHASLVLRLCHWQQIRHKRRSQYVPGWFLWHEPHISVLVLVPLEGKMPSLCNLARQAFRCNQPRPWVTADFQCFQGGGGIGASSASGGAAAPPLFELAASLRRLNLPLDASEGCWARFNDACRPSSSLPWSSGQDLAVAA